jgi:drug/metabolite transporter superfamily protein YnfA
MDDFPTKIADFLESTAQKIRAMTVDRVRNVARWTALGFLLVVLAFTAVLFLLIGIFRALGELIGVTTAYAAVGGLFIVIGAFLWSRRIPKTVKVTKDDD